MRIVDRHDILRVGAFARSRAWKKACSDVNLAIKATVWPPRSRQFTIYPESGKKRGQGSGVKPIKRPCLAKLRALGWQTEQFPRIGKGVLTPGDLDALYHARSGYIGFEWETGNISSSHRAVNKLLLTLQLGGIIGALLAVPSDELKKYLTDRIANIGELRPYFPLWESVSIPEGAFSIIVVEHDATSRKVPRIPKATDGRAQA